MLGGRCVVRSMELTGLQQVAHDSIVHCASIQRSIQHFSGADA